MIRKKLITKVLIANAVMFMAAPVEAYEIYDGPAFDLDFDLTAALGIFNSQKAYAQSPSAEESSPTWEEGFVRYGSSGEYELSDAGSLFGGFGLVSGANRGDVDAAGFSIGKEEDTDLENAYIGWRSGDSLPWLGKDGFELSFGRQFFKIGRGFLISGDPIDYGEGFDGESAPGGISRGGGTYYLAGRSTFDNTAILSLGGEDGIHADAFWLKSDNVGQGEPEFAGGNLEFRDDTYGTLGLTYLKGLSVDKDAARYFGFGHRDGQETWAIRGQGHLGLDNLNVAGEYANQDNGRNGDKDHAWYTEIGWTFSEQPWTPSVTYRFASYSEGFDSLFWGFENYGTWYQGTVAGNYAGPFNSSSDIQHIGLTLTPTERIELGALYFNFDNTAGSAVDADEFDFYAFWLVNEHLAVSPLIGFYSPDRSFADGGTQIGDDNTNIYTQLTATVSF